MLKGFETARVDKSVSQKIRDAYPAWKSAHDSALPAALVWIVLSGAAVLLIPVIAVTVKKRKIKR